MHVSTCLSLPSDFSDAWTYQLCWRPCKFIFTVCVISVSFSHGILTVFVVWAFSCSFCTPDVLLLEAPMVHCALRNCGHLRSCIDRVWVILDEIGCVRAGTAVDSQVVLRSVNVLRLVLWRPPLHSAWVGCKQPFLQVLLFPATAITSPSSPARLWTVGVSSPSWWELEQFLRCSTQHLRDSCSSLSSLETWPELQGDPLRAPRGTF